MTCRHKGTSETEVREHIQSPVIPAQAVLLSIQQKARDQHQRLHQTAEDKSEIMNCTPIKNSSNRALKAKRSDNINL